MAIDGTTSSEAGGNAALAASSTYEGVSVGNLTAQLRELRRIPGKDWTPEHTKILLETVQVAEELFKGAYFPDCKAKLSSKRFQRAITHTSKLAEKKGIPEDVQADVVRANNLLVAAANRRCMELPNSLENRKYWHGDAIGSAYLALRELIAEGKIGPEAEGETVSGLTRKWVAKQVTQPGQFLIRPCSSQPNANGITLLVLEILQEAVPNHQRRLILIGWDSKAQNYFTMTEDKDQKWQKKDEIGDQWSLDEYIRSLGGAHPIVRPQTEEASKELVRGLYHVPNF